MVKRLIVYTDNSMHVRGFSTQTLLKGHVKSRNVNKVKRFVYILNSVL